MAEEHEIYRFGGLELDAVHCSLTRNGQSAGAAPRSVEVLRLLVRNAGTLVFKDTIIAEVWQNAVDEGSLSRAIWDLRKILRKAPTKAGKKRKKAEYIETRRGQGFVFVGAIERVTHDGEASLRERVERLRSFIDGRVAVESFDCRVLMSTRETFADALATDPDDVEAHLGMANACLLTFEASRADLAPDVAALRLAEYHARRAWQLERSARTWSTWSVVLDRIGQRGEGLLAAREAVRLEPGAWIHHLRHALVSWADERLLAAGTVLKRCPELAPARWLAATVHVARQSFDCAFEDVRAGCAAQDAQPEGRRFRVVGFHLLHGLLLLACGRLDEALAEFDRELESCDDHHVYSRERAANTWCARGALQLRRGRSQERGP